MATSTRSGDVLAGRYRLIDLLSESGGGRFWRAHDAVLERYVALHVIAEDDPRAAGLVEAARTSAAVLDSRILRVLDAEREGGKCFVVNEWGTGISLDILVTNAGPLPPRQAAWLVADVAGAIARAHDAGVTHGRLNPENVLIDRYGAVRLIGLCVDAALHGLPPAEPHADLEDLGGLLHCALTATWPGPSGSIVPAAPRENGAFLSPRQVRAGVPGALDVVWRELDRPAPHRGWRHRGPDLPDVGSARAIARELLEFVGDPAGMPEALAQSIPPVNELRPVWLPAVDDPLPHDSSHDDIPVVEAPLLEPEPEPEPEPDPAPDTENDAASDTANHAENQAGPDPSDRPTEAGMPVFGGGGDDVQWLRTRSTPPPPPPPFEDLPERPLFAPEPAGGARRPSPDLPPAPLEGTGHWPWDTGTGVGQEAVHDTTEGDPVPGRSWLRLAMAVGVAVLLLVAVAIAFNLGRGRTPLGRMPDDATTAPTATATLPAAVLTGITGSDLDPLGDGSERPEDVANVLDGDPATTWSTLTYDDQFGPPPGLKTGLGIVLDLGRARTVSSVEVGLAAGNATVELYAADAAPTAAPAGEPAATASGDGPLRLTPSGDDGTVTARYLVLWLTALPRTDDGFRAEIPEVVVRGR